MSKRGRRRNSKRRKSSSSSKQSVSPYIFRRQNKSNSVTYKDDIVEKGETDSFGKENLLSGSEDDEKYNNAPSSETRFQQDYNVNSFPNQRSIYTKMTEDKEKGVRIVTSVSVNDMEDPSPKIMFQQSHEPLSKNLTDSSAQVTNIMNIYCNQSDVKFEIQEILQLTTSGINTTFVLTNNDKASTESFRKCEKTWIPNNESFEQPSPRVKNHNGKQNTHLFTGSFTFSRKCEQTESHNDSKYESLTNKVGNTSSSICCSDHKQLISTEFVLENHPSSPPTLSNVRPQEKINQLHKSISSSQFCDIPPPQEFADVTCNTLEDLTHDLASCGINYSPASKQQSEVNWTPQVTHKDSGSLFSVETEKRADLAPSFDELSHSANYDPVLKRPTLFTSSYKDFINFEKRKSCTRNNSIATVEHKVFLFPEKRRQTFPGSTEGLGLMQGDLMLPYTKSFYSLIMSLPPLQTERLQRIHQGIYKFSAFGVRNSNSSQTKGSSEFVSGIQNSHDGKQSLLSPFYMATSEENHDDDTVNGQCTIQSRPQGNYLKHTSIYDDMEILNTSVYQNDEAANGVNQGIGEIQHINQEPLREDSSQRSFAIHVIPPSCSSSEEHMLQNNPVTPLHSDQVENDCQDDSVSFSSEHRKSSVTTITAGALEQRLMASGASPVQEMNIPSLNTNKMETKQCLENINDQQLVTASKVTEEGDKLAVIASCPAKGLMDAEIYTKELLSKTDKADKQLTSRSSLEAKEHLKPVILKEPDSSGSDHWAKRRKLFKESKQWSSAGGSSITSDITEESVSEETRSMDMSFQDIEDRGFYTETFHSSAWIYQGDDGDSGTLPSSLNTRTRAISIRERTVKISKGTGEYPWGFRIQFSKPIVVTEVDTNGAAEEAGLMVGDLLLAVNGTDVTSIPHSEAADLARQGPDILTLTIGSDIARCPNTPRPACRGYLHKRTQSGLIKGWRKRWFVLTHDCCLSYYRHKRDEGKRQALSAIKLEGAHVEKDVSLGKPFVFKCNPQSGNRVYFFCATSSQDMKRWLEAIGKAIHPITQNHVWMDVTRHNSNLPPLAVKNPECLGLLHKMDKNKEMWVQHYCILKDGCLSMYSGIRATHAHGGIYLQGYVVREQPYGSKKSAIELKPPSDEFKTFYLCAENSNENKRWIIALRASIKKWVPLHQALQDYMNLPSEETRM